MTFAIFIVLILGFFVAVLNILPTASTLAFSFTPAVVTIISYMHAWDYLFPVHELLALVLIMLIVEAVIWAWHVLFRVAKFIRGHSDGS